MERLSQRLYSFPEATERSTRIAVRSYQVLDRGAAAPVRDVGPDVIENEARHAGRGSTPRPSAPDTALRHEHAEETSYNSRLRSSTEGIPMLLSFD